MQSCSITITSRNIQHISHLCALNNALQYLQVTTSHMAQGCNNLAYGQAPPIKILILHSSF
ncbi:hypothetical protein CW304_24835 [Bacillus sp. UFRGS-B20]|nr:hypothetical protein CW304_24835 [Bacillus sp. UFRGS-B20]